jgi:hypothetical protein
MCFYVENDIYYLRELEDDLCELTRTRWVSRVNSDWFKLMSGKLLGRVRLGSIPFFLTISYTLLIENEERRRKIKKKNTKVNQNIDFSLTLELQISR